MRTVFLAGLLVSLPGCFAQAQSERKAPAVPPAAPAQSIDAYIRQGWNTLSRSMSECKSVVDPKVKTVPVMYLPFGTETPASVTAMQAECHVEVRHLPRAIHHLGEVMPRELPVEGLLYLPNQYVVPGGRFNEMYGWDSYFILLGLEHDDRTDLARGMVENFFFEIENYGAILNANRTYFFTRSQPPFLTSMIREVYEHPAAGAQPDRAWLAKAYGYAERDYALWVSAPHKAGETGLARYNDLGEGPVPEMADDSSYYPDVIRWLLAHPGIHPEYLVNSSDRPNAAEARGLALQSCDVNISKVCAAAVVDGHRLSAAYYKSDRAMRESGFDTSFRFGPFSGSTSNYAPVCLNSLLYKYERDMADFARMLGKTAEASLWTRRAEARQAAIDKYLWDAASGMYLDYDFTTGQRSTYRFVTTYYPLWVGAASAEQAASVEKKLPVFEQNGGLQTSDYQSGVQWDAPFGWAPITWLAVSGLEKSGFHEDAVRISNKFRATILENFERDGTIREKYNVVSGSANVKVAAGYKSNVVGFGWTNAVYLKMGDLVGAARP
jgi:alpha,alpha-trehalase